MNIQTHFQLEKHIVSKYKLKIRAKNASAKCERIIGLSKSALVTPSPILLVFFQNLLCNALSGYEMIKKLSLFERPFELEQQGIRTVFKFETTLWCDLRRPSTRLNKMAWFIEFPVNAEKSTSRKQGDLCMSGSKSTTGIYDSPVSRPPPFLSTPTRPPIIHFGTR